MPVPSVKPLLSVKSIDGRSATVSIKRQDGKRGRPAKVASATIVALLPDGSFQFLANTTRTTETITFPSSAVGDAVTITAFWTNAKDESGPAATPLTVNLPAGEAMPVAQAKTMKLAA